MRVLIADPNPQVRTALRLLIEHHAEMKVVCEALDVIQLLSQATDRNPDLVLLDTDLPGLQLPHRNHCSPLGELVQALRKICPGATIVVLSGQPIIEPACLGANADEYFYKGDPPEELLTFLNQIFNRSEQ